MEAYVAGRFPREEMIDMGYAQDREEFVYAMARAGMSLYAIRCVLREAHRFQRGAEIACSVNEPDDVRAARELAEAKAAERVAEHFRALPVGHVLSFHGDPRGYVIKVTMRGEERGVPALGLSASTLEWMSRAAESAS